MYICIQIETSSLVEGSFPVFQFGSEGPHYEEYKSYIEFEKSQGDPSRVQSIFERAVVENCLKEDLWLDYVKYMVSFNLTSRLLSIELSELYILCLILVFIKSSLMRLVNFFLFACYMK